MAAVLIPARSSQAIEAFDGRFQLHGFYENQTRVIARNFEASDGFDLTQWYQVLNLEMELDIAPDGFGPFDIISAYARVEARFDCVYDRACWLLPSVNTYGDRTRHLPERLSDSRRAGYTDNQFTGHTRDRHGIPFDRLSFPYGVPYNIPPGTVGYPLGAINPYNAPREYNSRKPMNIWNVPGIDTLFGVKGIDGILGSDDDPAAYVLERFLDYKFASRMVKGSEGHVGTQLLGPWLPKNFVDPIDPLSDRANPFSSLDVNEVVLGPGMVGGNARPYRPAPLVAAGTSAVSAEFARGIYYPNQGVQRLVREHALDNPDQNFREAELKWNRGSSQQETKELKEAYVDLELFDSALWLRLGKQSIVWGKTELFRTTDQFNPQDLALATLPSLEESRIALWAARAVWSLWSVGPLEDVRLEFAANIDHFESADFGQCGEPYTVNAACNLRAGLFAHGITGYGLVGATKPPDPWDNIRGLEFGFRAEFRWDRFSFAITDFYGYDDFPYADQVFRYSRNVDPYSGRPRPAESTSRCILDMGPVDGADDAASSTSDAPAAGGGVFTGQPGCLAGGNDALVNHHANQQLFAFICSTSIGFTTLDSSVCAQSVFNSPTIVSGFQISEVIGTVLTGDPGGLLVGNILLGTLTGIAPGMNNLPFVDLGLADRDGNGTPDNPPNNGYGTAFAHLDNHLSAAQRALLGCGPYWGQPDGAGFFARPCSQYGIDLLNAEASALTSAWITQPGVQGTSYLNLTGPAPGTVGWYAQNGRFNCQRYVEGVGNVTLPGCRAPTEPGYDPFVDYDPALIGVNEAVNGVAVVGPPFNALFDCGPAGLNAEGPNPAAVNGGFCGTGNPFTGEPWYSTMDAFSWNFQMLLVVFTAIGATGQDDVAATPDDLVDIDVFDPRNPLAEDKCSWVAPQYCSNVQALLSVMGRRRNSVLAGGNDRYGREDFVWHGGSSNRLKWKRRNVLGFAMDFAEDVTKTNWSVESTWLHDLVVADNDSLNGRAKTDQFNLTISVDRPTFINFLNQGRTFFINSQWFFRYETNYDNSQPRNGPVNVLFTLTAFTGFYQDRLNPSFTHVFDFMSQSGAVLPSIGYRFSDSFSVEFGLAFFYGKWQSSRMPLEPVALGNQAGAGAYREYSERGLAVVRDRDEAFLRIRKTF